MGSQTSSIKQKFESEYDFIEELTDARFNKIYHVCLKKQPFTHYFFKTRPLLPDERVKDLKTHMDIVHQNIVKNIAFNSNQSFFDNETILEIFFEYVPWDLDREIDQRISNDKRFEEQDLIYMINSIASAGSYLQERYILHGFISTQYLLFDEQGILKIPDIEFVNGRSPYFEKPQKKQYPSPLENEKRGGNPFKNDVFAFGCCMLHAATLRSVQLYDDQGYLDSVSLKFHQNLVKELYSDELYEIITLMMEPNEFTRPDWIQLNAIQKKVVSIYQYISSLENNLPNAPENKEIIKSNKNNDAFVACEPTQPKNVIVKQMATAILLPEPSTTNTIPLPTQDNLLLSNRLSERSSNFSVKTSSPGTTKRKIRRNSPTQIKLPNLPNRISIQDSKITKTNGQPRLNSFSDDITVVNRDSLSSKISSQQNALSTQNGSLNDNLTLTKKDY